MANSIFSANGSERHYRVIRYYSDFGHGIMKDVIAEDLTLDEAERLANENRGEVSGEDVVIQDQLRSGLESEVIAEPRPNTSDKVLR